MQVLTPGSRLGPYEVQALIGQGGMGEVYRATDTRLRRDVALKVLPSSFAADAERLARFEREAHVLASLNHPHIAQIHGLEETDGTPALVMELVDGPTLAERIAQGPLPVDEALGIARQIAEALEAAHDAGIIHRDLKPANIKLRPDGTVKVLDFGLAKALESTSGSASPANSPTFTTPAMTVHGVILGTAAYMSPEQARGKAVDRRTDIWAFGCVLFEMLAGKPAFAGETVAETLSSIMRDEPAWDALPGDVPPHWRRILRACLRKDIKQRLRHIGDAFVELADAPEAVRQTRVRGSLPIVMAAALVGALAGAVVPWRSESPPPVTRVRLGIAPSELSPEATTLVAISPDGRRVAYAGVEQGTRQIYLLSFDQLGAVPVPGTVNGASPFFSPDGEWLGFSRAGALHKVKIGGGTVHRIANVRGGVRGVVWMPSNELVFGAQNTFGLQRVSADGGEPVPLSDTRDGRLSFRWPSRLDDDRLLVTAFDDRTRLPTDKLFVVSSKTGESTEVVATAAGAHYSPTGHLLYVNRQSLWAVPFDPDRLAVRGTPKVIVERVGGAAGVALSANGTLVFAENASGDQTVVEWLGNNSSRQRVDLPPGRFGDLVLSPDNTRLLMATREMATPPDIWMHELARGVSTRLTFDDGEEETPVWSPDARQIAFAASRTNEKRTVYVKDLATGAERALWTSDDHSHLYSWTPDGRYIVATLNAARTGSDIWRIRVDGSGAEPLLNSPFGEAQPAVSPDGKWLAYESDESGRTEVYVQPFGSVGVKHQVSIGGGQQPRWFATSDGIVFRHGGRFHRASVAAGGALSLRRPEPWLEDRSVQGGHFNFDVARDGRLLVAALPASAGGAPAAVFNLFAELRQKFATP